MAQVTVEDASCCPLDVFQRLSHAGWLRRDDRALDALEALVEAGYDDPLGLVYLAPGTLAALAERAWDRQEAGDRAAMAALARVVGLMADNPPNALTSTLLHALDNPIAFEALMEAGAFIDDSWVPTAHIIARQRPEHAGRVARAIATASGHGRLPARARGLAAQAAGQAALEASMGDAMARFRAAMGRLKNA